ncbi:nucleotide-binding alpha-beta plait domain-containing protein [Tanacetum coccineum]
MGSFRSKEDDVAKISTSIFVSNFSDSVSAKDLFHSCKQYGHVVDSFIPMKRLKDGKRFGFVRFINVFNVERLVNNLYYRNNSKGSVTNFKEELRILDELIDKGNGSDEIVNNRLDILGKLQQVNKAQASEVAVRY